LLLPALAAPVWGATGWEVADPTAPLSASALVEFQQLAAKPIEAALPEQLTAFEEHKLFVYQAAATRRVVFLRNDIFVIEDRIRPADAGQSVVWSLRMPQGKKRFFSRTLLPEGVTTRALEKPQPRIEVTAKAKSGKVRFLHVIHIPDGEKDDSVATAKATEKDGRISVTVATKEKTLQWTIPADADDAGTIAITKPDDTAMLKPRPLPGGILPHGERGTRLLDRWDSAYRGGRRPGWDVGRPSTKLIAAVEEGTIKPGRAVVLGCGTGTNAIYLAKNGFDVTGIDIAPTALVRAKEKADKAGVKVRWLLADVTAPPKIRPFDFIFDRGCYHGVRRSNAAGYVKSLIRLSKPGTQALILAGNANEERHYGPPRVKEEELRGDFTASFDFVWLKETTFDTSDPNRQGKGPMAWSILLRRKGAAKE